MIISYRYRIEPTRTQSALLSEMLRDFCDLYNGALEHRISEFRKRTEKEAALTPEERRDLKQHKTRQRSQVNEQICTLPEIRRDLPHYLGRWSATAEQQVLRRLEKAYKAFFRRIKAGEKAGFPRFRVWGRYHAADFCVGDGLTIRPSGKLRFVGIDGEIKVRWHRALPSKPSYAILSRNAGKWYIIFHVEVAPVERASSDSVGIDVGLTSLVALSTGELIPRPNITKRHARKLRVRQRALERCKRGSKIRAKRKAAVAKLHAHIGSSRRDSLHKISTSIVRRFGRIAVEDLNVKGLAAGMLAKDVNDAAWTTLIEMLTYKAEKAGCELVKVDPRGTSQTCPECGTIAKKILKQRTHICDCGCVLDRDVAAAIVIHQRAFDCSPGMGDGQPI